MAVGTRGGAWMLLKQGGRDKNILEYLHLCAPLSLLVSSSQTSANKKTEAAELPVEHFEED